MTAQSCNSFFIYQSINHFKEDIQMKLTTKTIPAALAVLMLLSACSAAVKQDGEGDRLTPPTTEKAQTEQPAPPETSEGTEQPEDTPADVETAESPSNGGGTITAPDGETLSLSDAECYPHSEGIDYYSFPQGYISFFDGEGIYNSIDDPDMFDAETWAFLGENKPAVESGTVKVTEGDTAGGMTVGATNFVCIDFNGEVSIGDANLIFLEGEMELTGYITQYTADDGYFSDGDIVFYPTELPEQFPVYWGAKWGVCAEKDFLIYTPIWFRAGNVEDYDFDTSCIPENHEVAPVKVTLSRIIYSDRSYLHNEIGGGMAMYSAEISSIQPA